MKYPLEKTDPGHYQYVDTNYSVQSILARLRRHSSQPIDTVTSPRFWIEENGFYNLDFPEKTYFRLFKRRYSEKKKKRLYGPMYVVMTVNKQPIATVTTKKEALHILSQSRPKRKVFRKPHKDSHTGEWFGDLEVGSFILKIPRKYKYDVSQRDHLNDTKHIVATKKCAECPNKTSTRGACHCGFWSVIRDSTMGGQWWSMHDIKRYQKREQKRKVFNIVLTKEELFNN